jgi:hypothetical protein
MPLTIRPRGWPASQTSWPAGPTLPPHAGWLHGDTLQETIEWNPKLKVDGGQTPWLVGHMAGRLGHHLACYQLNQVGNLSLDPYKYPLLVEIKATLTTLWFSTCKDTGLE